MRALGTDDRYPAVPRLGYTRTRFSREEKMNAPLDQMTAANRQAASPALPFNAAMLDRLMEDAGIDVLLVSSKHNIQYLFGGYRFFFFDHFDAIGVSRYLPLLIYPKGEPARAVYLGHGMEKYEEQLGKFWIREFEPVSGSVGAMQAAVRHLRRIGPETMRIGVERAFLPADAEGVLKSEMPRAALVDALVPLERLRARKTAAELQLVKQASERVVDAMLAVIAKHGPGSTKHQIIESLRLEEVQRGLNFEYCLMTAGTSLNRAPSDQVLAEGDIFSIDSGGNYHGYIGDLCRMGIMGEPDAELDELLAEIDAIQLAARNPIRAGARGGDIFTAAEEPLRKSRYGNSIEFVAHGMGLITHEAPRLTDRGPIPYPAYDADRPLEPGMVISIETTLPHPRRGFIKLEDTVAVTETGWEAFGDAGRGWNRAGGR
jgi:Xaa-Pro aminopeptidase